MDFSRSFNLLGSNFDSLFEKKKTIYKNMITKNRLLQTILKPGKIEPKMKKNCMLEEFVIEDILSSEAEEDLPIKKNKTTERFNKIWTIWQVPT